VHVRHPLLREGSVEFRGYQANLARIAQKQDTLVVLPTGMGKTIVALLVIGDALQAGAQRVLLLAPTRPLVEQHVGFLRSVLLPPWGAAVRGLTGNVSPAKRNETYGPPGIVVATPQVLHNDVVAGLDISAFDWVVFDEAHRAAGDYPYTFLGQELQKRAAKTRRLGLTASPGHDLRKIEEVRSNLGLRHVEIRTPADSDVAPYVQDVEMEWETLPLPPTMGRVSVKLHEALADRVRQLKGLGVLKSASSKPTKRELLELQGKLQGMVRGRTDPDPSTFAALSLQAQAMKLMHAIEQVETQGAAAFVEYMDSIREEVRGAKPSKAARSLADDPRVNDAFNIARLDDAENPKVGRTTVLVREAVAASPQSRVIVFCHYRSTCEQLAQQLGRFPNVRPVVFVGQGKRRQKEGLTQKEQADIIARFKQGEFNVLVATSVAEEGLDIPETDLVVFYEPIPSEIRSIQRRGRTGRKRAGRVVVLMTKGTQDEAAHWSSRRKEQAMVRELHALRGQLAGKGLASLPPRPPGKAQTTLPTEAQVPGSAAVEDEAPRPLGSGPRILFDHREQAGGVVRHLRELGAALEARQLDVGDFVLSDRVVVERKGCADFVDSLVDGRLFDQLKAIKAYPVPIVVLEGDSLFGHRQVSAEALFGAVASIGIDYGIPVLQTRTPEDTARLLHAVAKREQQREGRKVAVRHGKPMTDFERQLYLLSGLPGVSDILARRLLERFGSVRAVVDAPVAALAEVDGIGGAKASEIRRILDLEAILRPELRARG
jgi:ERCC4-related helicase/ERCC4-type nuclease